MKTAILHLLCVAACVAGQPLRAETTSTTSSTAPSTPDRPYLTGDWGGLRAEESGIKIDLSYTQEYMGVVSGGIHRQGVYDALASLELELDLEKLIGWKGAVFHATGLSIIGSSLSAEAVGDDGNVSNINYRNSVRLFELWLEQSLFDNHLSIRVGQMAADSEFFGSEIGDIPGGGLFLYGDFGAMPIASFNAPVPIYAIAAPGVRVEVKPTESTFLRAAIYDGNPAPDFLGDPSPGFHGGDEYNDHGVHVNLNSDEGFFLIGETGIVINQGEEEASTVSSDGKSTSGTDGKSGKAILPLAKTDGGLPGSYKVGGFYHSDDFTRWSDGTSVRGTWGFYAIGAQKVWNESPDEQGLYLFARASTAPKGRSTIDWAVDGGLNYVGLVPGRDGDIFGVGYSYKHYSGDLSDSLVATGDESLDAESILEVTYQVNLTPWLTVQPDFQYVFQPGGRSSSSDAAVLGIRVSTLF